jgi:hypothetical protein
MHHSHTLAVPTRSRTQRLIPLVIGVLAAALIVLALVQPGADKPASPNVARPAPSQPATVARPDESGIAAAIAPRPQAGPNESAIAATIGRSAQPQPLDEEAASRKWKAYDDAIQSLSQTTGGESLSQIKRDAQYMRAR